MGLVQQMVQIPWHWQVALSPHTSLFLKFSVLLSKLLRCTIVVLFTAPALLVDGKDVQAPLFWNLRGIGAKSDAGVKFSSSIRKKLSFYPLKHGDASASLTQVGWLVGSWWVAPMIVTNDCYRCQMLI